jgi:hypothetical protein
VLSQRPKLEMRKGIETMQGSVIRMRIGQFRNFSLIDLLKLKIRKLIIITLKLVKVYIGNSNEK